jgi:glucose/galactose transporter
MMMKRLPAMLIIGMLFFIFGFISWINAILIPYFKLCLQLSVKEAMMVAFAFYVSYFVMAIPSAGILTKTGLKKGMMLGLLIMAAGAVLFIPSAYYRNYPLFLTGLFTQASGLTILQAAANPYVTMLGPLETAARRMSIMGICNKVAGAIAPLILLHAITKSPQEIDDINRLLPTMSRGQSATVFKELLLRLQLPYGVIGVVLVVLALFIQYSGLPEAKPAQQTVTGPQRFFKYPQLVLGTIAIFCGVSVEVLAVDSIVNYAEFQGYNFENAKFFASATLALMIAGYLLGIICISRLISQEKALALCGITGAVLTVFVLTTTGSVSVWSVASLGLCNALLWPSIWPLALRGLGDYTERGAAFLIMAIVGGAITPLAFGALAGAFNQQWAYIILVPLYLFLLSFAVYSLKAMQKEKKIIGSQLELQID